MRPIPLKLRAEMASDPYYKRCALSDECCGGRITWEHALKYKGGQVNEKFAIIPLCINHHLGKYLNKQKNEWIALNRATQEDFEKYSRADWKTKKEYLNKKFNDNK